MFERLTLRGSRAAIMWGGYRTAAALTAWAISKQGPQWILNATIEGVDQFVVKQSPLYFTAVRHYGHSCWPVIAGTVQVRDRTLVATLGAPEQ